MMSIRQEIQNIINSISPFDEKEQEHITFTKSWVESEVEIFRIAKPATPDTHLVAYFLLMDPFTKQVLLVDHKKAGLWLPAGGHVELNEHPKETVKREVFEELRIEANFLMEDPLFLTVTKTIGFTAGHTDVSLWYILEGCASLEYTFDAEELIQIRWFFPDEIPYNQTDPHMRRFMEKLSFMETRKKSELRFTHV